ncbi:MAG: alpha/beta fold hydrolase [Betaproteobacteria bacterium]
METAALNEFRPRLSGSILRIDTAAGPVAVHTAGSGPPLLLVHSVNAAASAAEVRPLHEHYAATHTVFSPDLPGYGATARPKKLYTPRLMTDALHGVTRHIRSQFENQAVDALALSLSCEFLARAALETPADYRSLALVSPTGLSGSRPRRGPSGSTAAMPRLHSALQRFGPGLFALLTRPAVIRFFLRKTWGGPDIDPGMFEQAVATARVNGAEHAPLSFLSGALFSRDILSVYESLRLPVWLCHGVRGDFTDYRQKALLAQSANWRMTVFPTGALPHFECLPEFCAALDQHLAACHAPAPTCPPAAQ